MGLDMCLRAKRHLHPSRDEEVELINALNNQIGLQNLPESEGDMWEALRVSSVSIRVMDWRKDNAIHRWFLLNAGDGMDDCRPMYVSRSDLEELKGKCEQVLADNSKAKELLPTQSGFFFGSTDYDEWYFEGIKRTATELGKILTNEAMKPCDFEYQASW